MIRFSHIVTPGVVYHAELEGELLPHPQATLAEREAMNMFDEDEVALTAMQLLWNAEVGRGRIFVHDLHIPRVKDREGVCEVVPFPVPTRFAHGGKHDSREALRGTWALLRETGSLSATARAIGISVSTVRARIIRHRMACLRDLGMPVPSFEELLASAFWAPLLRDYRKAA